MKPEVAAFVRVWGLDDACAAALDALVAGRDGATRPAGATLVVDDLDAPEAPAPLPERYRFLGRIAVGGMGEVWRVRDFALNRDVALKVLREDLAADRGAVARFVDEAQCAAQLQHPGVVPVHEVGRLPDGRPYFTMPEVQGRTLAEVFGEAEAPFARRVELLRRACEAVAYAHARGVVHRDLKPDNVMVGEHGEVFVLDWGLAEVVGGVEAPVVTQSPPRTGRSVAGTPAYMSPEQARGEVVDARSDVYALGAILYELLADHPPYRGTSWKAVLALVRAAPPPALDSGPPELIDACARAMARDPGARFPDAGAFAAELSAWIEGTRRRERALAVLAEAGAIAPRAALAAAEAARLRREAVAWAREVPSWAPLAQKEPLWALEDEAARLEAEHERLWHEGDQAEQAALGVDPGLPEAHAASCARLLARHAAIEAARGDTAPIVARLRQHADALPPDHPARLRVDHYLAGVGEVEIVADADVEIARIETAARRRVPGASQPQGRAPWRATLPIGSYVATLRAPGRDPVTVPFVVRRGQRWSAIPPGADAPMATPLPATGALGHDDVVVPAGWFDAGGDPGAVYGWSGRRVWCDAFVMRRFPVTNHEYIAFLDDLVASGREDEALRWVPRERPAVHGDPGPMCYGRAPDGRFVLVADAEGDAWLPDYPVLNVNYGGARAYARWVAARTGQPWRLPFELEFEKAARGVDGRAFPFGDHFDGAFACARESHAGRGLPAVIADFPLDVSVYGVRGLAGNVATWCLDFGPDLDAALDGDRVRTEALDEPDDPDPDHRRYARGGSWLSPARFARSAERTPFVPTAALPFVGIRLVRIANNIR